MTARLTAQDVIKVASLARLRLSDEEVASFTPQLADVLAYVDLLDELDVSDVAPMAHAIEQHNVLRDDVTQTSLTPAEALRNAPKYTKTLCVKGPSVYFFFACPRDI